MGAYYVWRICLNKLKNAINDGNNEWTSQEIAQLEEVVAAYGSGLYGNTGKQKPWPKARIKGARSECILNISILPLFARCRPSSKGEQLDWSYGARGRLWKVYERAFSIDKVHTRGKQPGEVVENLNIVHHATYKRKPKIKWCRFLPVPPTSEESEESEESGLISGHRRIWTKQSLMSLSN